MTGVSPYIAYPSQLRQGWGRHEPMKQTTPLTRDLVLIGGGHAHALVLRRWGMTPLPGARVTVINPGPTAPYSGMLPGFVAGHYGRDALDIDLIKLAGFAGARFINGAVTGIDLHARQIEVPGRAPIGFDVASVDVGITSAMPDLDGFADYGIPAKPLGTFAARWDTFRAEARDPHVTVIGGGVAGAELALAMGYALRDRAPQVTIIDRGDILGGLSASARAQMLQTLEAAGVRLIPQMQIRAVQAGTVVLGDGRILRSDFTTGAAGALPHDWIAATGLDCHDGFIAVGPTLQSSDGDVFAVGDCAHMTHDPRPKAGVFAVRQAPVLYDNLRARLSGRPLRPYRPQKDYLKLISLGGKSALAEKFGRGWRGPWLWRWKDRIDRRFMKRFDDLPGMDQIVPVDRASGITQAQDEAPFCTGCGAKVGRAALDGVITSVAALDRPDIRALPGDDAALLLTGGVQQVLTTDHLSAVTDDPALMARIATIHALGDIWAMGGSPQAAVLSLILPRMSPELQARTMGEITPVVEEVLTRAGAALVGGHTTMGDGLTVGVTLTGLCHRDPVTLAGAQVGDALVLNKPIGSGTILAAQMRGLAKGAYVLACLDQMIRPQGDVSHALCTAHAMTDVTGFGLAGHLAGICAASDVGARVALDRVPLMAGALELARAGVRSSLYPDNRALPSVVAPMTAQAALMFDPQTCGGLLAAVDPALADRLVKDGQVVRIGEITQGADVVFE